MIAVLLRRDVAGLSSRTRITEAREMVGIRIRDLDERKYLAFDLKEILTSLGPRGVDSEWSCSVEECISHDNDDFGLQDSFNTSSRIGGSQFATLAKRTRQIIDGVFEAFDPGASELWVKVEAIDSSYWEVYSPDPKVLAMISISFTAVEPVPDRAA